MSKAIVYTNRNGQTYYLCQTIRSTGKTCFVFSREPRGDPVTVMPAGYEPLESINGQVSLRKVSVPSISEAEVRSVRAALGRHPHLSSYRVEAKKETIVIHEPEGDVDPAILFQKLGFAFRGGAGFKMTCRYSPVFRFVLTDPEERTFMAERMCYRSSIDGWLSLHVDGSLVALAKRYLGHLGKDSFFELF
jgi:hypothetical protein